MKWKKCMFEGKFQRPFEVIKVGLYNCGVSHLSFKRTSKVLSNKRVFVKPNFSFHIPFNMLNDQHVIYYIIIWNCTKRKEIKIWESETLMQLL